MEMDFQIDLGSQLVHAEGGTPFPAKNTVVLDDCLLDAEDVAKWPKVSPDWVWDHAARRAPYLPAIWLSDGALRFRRNRIAEFINERERLSAKRRKRR